MVKCSICNEDFKEGVAKIVDGQTVHEECYEKTQKIKEQEEKEMIENEIKEVNEIKEEVKDGAQEPKCEIIIGMEQNGGLYFVASGQDPSLLNIEGLLQFGKKKLDKIWEERMDTPVQEKPSDKSLEE